MDYLSLPIYVAGTLCLGVGFVVVISWLVSVLMEKIGLIKFAIKGIKREYMERNK